MCNCNKRKRVLTSQQALTERAERIATATGRTVAEVNKPWPEAVSKTGESQPSSPR